LVLTDSNFITGVYVQKGRVLLGVKILLSTIDHSAQVNGYAFFPRIEIHSKNWIPEIRFNEN
jgi:hypothetical protein